MARGCGQSVKHFQALHGPDRSGPNFRLKGRDCFFHVFLHGSGASQSAGSRGAAGCAMVDLRGDHLPLSDDDEHRLPNRRLPLRPGARELHGLHGREHGGLREEGRLREGLAPSVTMARFAS